MAITLWRRRWISDARNDPRRPHGTACARGRDRLLPRRLPWREQPNGELGWAAETMNHDVSFALIGQLRDHRQLTQADPDL